MTPAFHDDRIDFIHHGDADGWIEAVAAEMAQTLNHDINEVGRARILLSGGTTPAPVYQALAELDVPPPHDPARYQVWLQTADETLDYRDAQAYYRACALRIQAGGDHGFQGFAERLPMLFAFAGIPRHLWQDIDFSALN